MRGKAARDTRPHARATATDHGLGPPVRGRSRSVPTSTAEVHVEIVVKTKNCEVPGKLKREAHERLAHATRFFDRVLGVEVVFAEETKRRGAGAAKVEVSARTKGHGIRAEATGPDHRHALDVALERLERRLARYKTRLTDRRRGHGREADRPAAPLAPVG